MDTQHLGIPQEVVYHLAQENSVFYSDTTRDPVAGSWGSSYPTLMEMGVTLMSHALGSLRVHECVDVAP